jgi:NAD(P)-dependent dehydrogenase (short-subunit alcohol dehydrogenase family)
LSVADRRICVITGATSGIGFTTAQKLARDMRLVLVGRDRARGEDAVARLTAQGADVSIFYADLSRLAEMRRLAAELATLPRLDVLINNAGAVFRRRSVTPDGLELTFALNHMSGYVLTRLLLPRLIASAPARIVNVSSRAHEGAAPDPDDWQMERRFDGWHAYCNSKLCNILFTRELARRLPGGVTVNCLHPGFVATRFGDNTDGLYRLLLGLGKRLVAISPERGAETSAYLATAPEVAGVSGRYFAKCRAREPTRAGRDDALALRLWRDSARIAGLPEAL